MLVAISKRPRNLRGNRWLPRRPPVDEAIAYARSRANNSELRNLRFEVRDLTTFDREASEAAYDLITAFDAIHDQARPDNVLAGIYRSLKPEGVFLMQDIRASSSIAENRDHPLHDLVHALHDNITFTRRYGWASRISKSVRSNTTSRITTKWRERSHNHRYRNQLA
jgi:SAM-dependent methyltransferase